MHTRADNTEVRSAAAYEYEIPPPKQFSDDEGGFETDQSHHIIGVQQGILFNYLIIMQYSVSLLQRRV